jgi:toxin ParE1/3/4
MIVIISDEAEADLEKIADRIADDNPARALSFVKELRGRCEDLADMSNAFPLVLHYEHVGIRRRVHGSYLIFYRVGASSIEVLHVLHGAMNYEPLLFPEG